MEKTVPKVSRTVIIPCSRNTTKLSLYVGKNNLRSCIVNITPAFTCLASPTKDSPDLPDYTGAAHDHYTQGKLTHLTSYSACKLAHYKSVLLSVTFSFSPSHPNTPFSLSSLPQPSWGQRHDTVRPAGGGGRKKQRTRCKRRGAVLPVLLFLTGKK